MAAVRCCDCRADDFDPWSDPCGTCAACVEADRRDAARAARRERLRAVWPDVLFVLHLLAAIAACVWA